MVITSPLLSSLALSHQRGKARETETAIQKVLDRVKEACKMEAADRVTAGKCFV